MAMGIAAFLDRPLCTVPLAEVAARSPPFELVAPLAAWYWISTDYRSEAEYPFTHLKSLDFEAIIACRSLDEVPLTANGSLLSRAYHRALLEIVSALYPQWQVQCNDHGHLCFAGSNVGRAQGQQFGMLAIFPDTQALAVHLNVDLGQMARTYVGATRPEISIPSRQRPSLGPRR
jgi:hypothetical protein